MKENSKNKERFPTRKDLTYWLVFLVFIIIFIFVIFTREPGSVNAKLSLAGTLASIALAIIAILFSFFQSSDSSEQNIRLIDEMRSSAKTLELLSNVAEKLEIQAQKSREEILKISDIKIEIQNEFSNFENQIKQMANKNTDNDSVSKVTNDLLEDIKEVKNKNPFLMPLTIWGPNALLNTLKQHTTKGEYIYFEDLRIILSENNLNVSAEEVMKNLQVLESRGDISISQGNVKTLIKLLV